MANNDWVPITGTDADPLIGDSEIVAVHFRSSWGLVLDLENGFPDGTRTSQLRFIGVRFFQMANDGLHYLDRIEIVDSVTDVLNNPEMAPYLRSAFGESSHWFRTLPEVPGLKVYRLMPIAGAETFIACQEAEMRPWRPKPE